MAPQPIDVVGGGLVGSLAAVMLAQRGFPVTLHERRPDMRKVDMAAGRSINLVVTARGLQALDIVGLRDQVLELGIPMTGRMLHDEQGDTKLVPYGQKDDEVIYAVSRGILNKTLLAAAGNHPNITIKFDRKCTGYDIADKTLTFLNEGTGDAETTPFTHAIGTDGAWSAMRRGMLKQVMNFNYEQSFLDHGYKELVIPPTADGGFRIDKNALHIWPRRDYMMIALPNLDGSFTCTLFMAYKGENSFENLNTPQDVMAFFNTNFPDAVPLMPDLVDDFFENPTGSMVTVRCFPWAVGDQSVLLGDASHAIVPFFGQGMNSGFEDCTELSNILDQHGQTPDWEQVFDALQHARKPNTDAIADLALENFVEMRDTTSDPKFQLKKDIGFALENRFPGQFIPRYSMIVFHPEIPYAEAQRRGKIQDQILDELCANIQSADQTDWRHAQQLIDTHLG